MSVNTIQPRDLTPILNELASKGFSREFQYLIRQLAVRNDKCLKDDGSIQSASNISGRTEPLGTTLQNVDAAGKLTTADAIAADGATYGRVNVAALTSGNVDFSKAGVTNKTTDNLTDGTGSPLTGGKRGFVALDANNRLSGTFHNNPVNVSMSPGQATTLSTAGTVISVAADTVQFGAGSVSYNSGSVDPGANGKFWINASDPTFAGGAVIYSFSGVPTAVIGSDGILPIGAVNDTSGATTGGGYTGGTSKGAGGRGFAVI